MELRFQYVRSVCACDPDGMQLAERDVKNRVWRQIEHAGQKMIEYEHSEGGSVNVNFEVADVTRRLVAVGGLQRRGMTVVLGPHGSFVTRGRVAKPTGGILVA